MLILEHVNLTVSDLDRSIDLYCRLFDYRVRWRGTLTDGRPAAHVGTDEHYLALFQAKEPGRVENDYTEVGLNHFGLVVDDLDSLQVRLRELGITPTAEQDYEPGRRVYFFDPDGIEIELIQYA